MARSKTGPLSRAATFLVLLLLVVGCSSFEPIPDAEYQAYLRQHKKHMQSVEQFQEEAKKQEQEHLKKAYALRKQHEAQAAARKLADKMEREQATAKLRRWQKKQKEWQAKYNAYILEKERTSIAKCTHIHWNMTPKEFEDCWSDCDKVVHSYRGGTDIVYHCSSQSIYFENGRMTDIISDY